jgi:heme/copper-type cytochrome/quinol oxidase subunit 2
MWSLFLIDERRKMKRLDSRKNNKPLLISITVIACVVVAAIATIVVVTTLSSKTAKKVAEPSNSNQAVSSPKSISRSDFIEQTITRCVNYKGCDVTEARCQQGIVYDFLAADQREKYIEVYKSGKTAEQSIDFEQRLSDRGEYDQDTANEMIQTECLHVSS